MQRIYTGPRKLARTVLSPYGRKIHKFCEAHKIPRENLRLKAGVSRTAMQHLITGHKVYDSTKIKVKNAMRSIKAEKLESGQQITLEQFATEKRAADAVLYCLALKVGSLKEIKNSVQELCNNGQFPEGAKIVEVKKVLEVKQKVTIEIEV